MAETVYQFPPSVKVRSGERVTMHCQLNEVQSFCHTVAWVRVHPVSGMIDILQDSNIPRQTKEQVETTVCQASIYNAATLGRITASLQTVRIFTLVMAQLSRYKVLYHKQFLMFLNNLLT